MASNNDYAQTHALATQLRSELERLPYRSRPLFMMHFPHGAASESSLLLGALLLDHGLEGFDYVAGERGAYAQHDWSSHAWLTRGDLVVDITADQFDDAPAAVIVSPRSSWHDQFILTSRERADFRLLPGCATLQPIYDQILAAIPTQAGERRAAG
ncbi:MAG: hypothetical protein AAF290_06925 [Pseudomonadota bacterium]